MRFPSTSGSMVLVYSTSGETSIRSTLCVSAQAVSAISTVSKYGPLSVRSNQVEPVCAPALSTVLKIAKSLRVQGEFEGCPLKRESQARIPLSILVHCSCPENPWVVHLIKYVVEEVAASELI